MAKATFVKSAQKDIYTHGKRVEYVSEKGKKAGETKSKIDRSIPENAKDEIIIKKGESYWWWQFMNGGKNISKEQPRQSQLTQSAFLSQLYALQERISDFTCDNKMDFDEFKEEIQSEVEEMRDQCEESRSNMPEGLQESGTGELLQERYDALDSYLSDLEGIECDYDEDDLKSQVKEENEDADETELEGLLQDKIQEIVDESIGELQNLDFGV